MFTIPFRQVVKTFNVEMVREALRELSSREWQLDFWVSGRDGLMSSLTEAAEELFSDSGLRHAIDRGKTGLSPRLLLSLDALSEAIREVPLNVDARALVDDPRMREVRQRARNASALLEEEGGP